MSGTADMGEYGPASWSGDTSMKQLFDGARHAGAAAVTGASAQSPALPAYDLLLRGGHVIDAKNNIDAVMDVAIKDGQIAQVAPNLKSADAIKTIDVARPLCHARPDRHACPCL